VSSSLVERETVRPPMLARMLGVGLDKIHTWIRSGELVASNLATRPTQRPRWQITREAVEQFLRRRSNAGAMAPTTRRRRPVADEYMRFEY
jgi:hypothetical protein